MDKVLREAIAKSAVGRSQDEILNAVLAFLINEFDQAELTSQLIKIFSKERIRLTGSEMDWARVETYARVVSGVTSEAH